MNSMIPPIQTVDPNNPIKIILDNGDILTNVGDV